MHVLLAVWWCCGGGDGDGVVGAVVADAIDIGIAAAGAVVVIAAVTLTGN